MNDPLIEQLKTGVCPFTGKNYNCERCEIKPEFNRYPTGEEGHTIMRIGISLCITGFVTGRIGKRELRQTTKMFTTNDGKNPTPEALLEYFKELYRLGANVIPLHECNNFCFRHGCMGEKMKESGNEGSQRF